VGIGSLMPDLRPAVFLDRDGVLNEAVIRDGKPFPPAGLTEMRINPEAPAALGLLKQLGFRLFVVTNQPDVGRGTQTREAVEEMDEALRSAMPIDDFFICYHAGTEDCDCRKPKPGLILEAARQHAVPLDQSFLIGDRWRDVDAGTAAGVRTIWIDYGYQERGPATEPSMRVRSLTEAAEWIRSVTKKDQ